jgi:hypothetical protein
LAVRSLFIESLLEVSKKIPLVSLYYLILR